MIERLFDRLNARLNRWLRQPPTPQPDRIVRIVIVKRAGVTFRRCANGCPLCDEVDE